MLKKIVPSLALLSLLMGAQTFANEEGDVQELSSFELSQQEIFNGEVHEVELHIKDRNFTRLIETCGDREAPQRHVAEFRFNDIVIPNIAIKLRGNTSRCNVKKQFKLNFKKTKNVYETTRHGSAPMQYTDEEKARIKEQKLFGLKGISLRSSANDDTMINEVLASQIFSQIHALNPTFESGPNVYRVALAKLYVSFQGSNERDYKGLYLITENIDETFLKQRLGKKTGTLVKARYNAEGKVDFAPQSFNPNVYDIKTFEGKDVDPGDEEFVSAEILVKDLIEKLNQSSGEEELAEFLDIDSILNYALGAHLTGHWDSLWGNYNNDHLVYNEKTGKWGLIVWDLDNTIGTYADAGTSLLGYDIQHESVLRLPRQPNLLFDKVFAVDSFKQRYIDLAIKAREGFYGSDAFNESIVNLRNQVRSHVPEWERQIFTRVKYERIFYFKNARLDALSGL